jgi:hypothetical protein
LKYSVILFLLLCEFTFGQIPGYPKFAGTRNFPTVYTLSYTLSADANAADVTAQVINTGSLINETGSPTPTVLVSGILWGNAPPTINDGFSSKTTDGRIDGQPFTTTISQFPEEGTIYIVAYATTAAGTFYGKVLTISQDVVRSPYTSKIWMDRNVGATVLPQSATAPSSQDSASMGGLYQWGRKSDGHQIVLPRNSTLSNAIFYSGTNSVRQSNWAVVSDKFYTYTGGSPASDWLTVTRNTLWQGLNGENNPCPAGFRVPTVTEFTNETTNFTQTTNGAFTSFLRLPATGYRNYDGTQGSYIGYNQGRYWTSSINGTGSYYLLFTSTGISSSGTGTGRIMGYAVRCIKGEATSGGSAVISGFTEGSLTGNLIIDEPASGVTKTIIANVTTAGSYNISTLPINNNGVVFSGSGTFTSTGNNKSITLKATGTPNSQGSEGLWTYYSNTEPQFAFNVTIGGDPSTNGTAIVTGYTSISSQGELFPSEDPTLSNVTQTIRANVTKTGTYYLKTTTNNGTTFTANGTFTNTGNNDITLVATGTPISSGDYSFTTNTNPSVSFTRESLQISTRGKAVVSGYTKGQAILDQTPGIKQTINANVTTAGTYNITTNIINGSRFAGTGTFTNTGNNSVTLTLTPTPTNYNGVYTFSLNTTPSATFSITNNSSSGGTALITWDGVSQLGLTTAQTTENNRNIVRLTEASTYSPPFIQYIAVNVTQIGTYNIETFGNRTNEGNTLRLVGSGTFTTTGVQTIPLYYYGAAINYNGDPVGHYFYLPNESNFQLYIIRNSQ